MPSSAALGKPQHDSVRRDTILSRELVLAQHLGQRTAGLQLTPSLTRTPVSTIYGLEPRSQLPENWTPLEAVAVIKCLDQDGEVAIYLSSTTGLMLWESVGMLTAVLDSERQRLQDCFIEDDDDQPGT